MKIWTGGPAFPVPGLQDDEDFNGMTLRDYFAAMAMQGIVESKSVTNDEQCASRAYSIADAMLAGRAK